MHLEYCELPVHELFGQLLSSSGIDLKTTLHPKQIPNFGEDFRRDPPVSYVQRICEIVNDWLITSQSRYLAKNTEGGCTPSLCVYGQNDTARQAYMSGLTFRKNEGLITETIAGVAWAWVVTIMEIDVRPTDITLEQSAERNTSDRIRRMLERQEVHVRKIMQYQHRRHVLTFLFQGREMRFAFWDRAGILLSEPVDYLDRPDDLFRLLSALTNAGLSFQGYDETVTLASPEQIHVLERYTPNKCHSDMVREELCLAKEAILGKSKVDRAISPIYCVKCEDTAYRESPIPQELRTYTYLIAGSDSSLLPLLGDGSRGFIAFDVDHNELVYLRDGWIPNESVNKNGLGIHEILSKAGVRYVPTVIAGGFIGTQATISQTLCLELGKDSLRQRERRHHRLVVAQIWRPLWSFKDARELVSAVSDALTAHQDAYESGGLLHRDVTTDNIVIDIFTGRGFLDGWGSSISRDELVSSPRVGTWTYMSGLLQTYPRKPNALSDDLESFVWSLVLPVLRFIVTDQSMIRRRKDGTTDIDLDQYNDMLGNLVDRTFHYKFRNGDHVCGGQWKIEQIVRYEDFAVKVFNQSGPLAKLLDDLFALLHEYYISLDETALKTQWGALGAGPRARPRKSWKRGYEEPRQRSDCLDKHERIRAVFAAALDDPTQAWTDKRTVDQFMGFGTSVPFYSQYKESPLQYGNAKRYLPSESDSDTGSDAEPEPKRARLGV